MKSICTSDFLWKRKDCVVETIVINNSNYDHQCLFWGYSLTMHFLLGGVCVTKVTFGESACQQLFSLRSVK